MRELRAFSDKKPAPIMRAAPSSPLVGDVRPPGDKSLSHRALILGAIAEGETAIAGLLEGDDIRRTSMALEAMGARQRRDGETWRVEGCGLDGLNEPGDILDMGNSGTGARLLMGLVGGRDMAAAFTGDASLRSRPMARVIDPLAQMGASALSRSGGRLPLIIQGAAAPKAISYAPPTPSAQVKSAILLAALRADGETVVRETAATRDHTERMLSAFGADISTEAAGGGAVIRLKGGASLKSVEVTIPADPSSAAFPIVAALIVPGSNIVVRDVLVNPTRAGLIATLIEMGGDIEIQNMREIGGEPVADLRVRHCELRAVDAPADRAPTMIDEYPILAVAAAFATGETVMRGLGELRVKESDRLSMTAAGLTACGAQARIEEDTLIVTGDGAAPKGGARVETAFDHRIAMAFLTLGLAAAQPVEIDDGASIDTSFPDFAGLMAGLGASVEPVAESDAE